MIELGKRQELEVLREKEFGVYLGEKERPEASVLLPRPFQAPLVFQRRFFFSIGVFM